MKVQFTANIYVKDWKNHSIRKDDGLLLLRYPMDQSKIVKSFFKAYMEKNEALSLKGKEPIDLTAKFEASYKRSIEANNLMWSLYKILAQVMQKENKSMNLITASELYDHDMERVAPKRYITCSNEDLSFFVAILEKEKGHVKNKKQIEEKTWRLEIWETSSFWDSEKMAEHIERLILELETMGVTKYVNGNIKQIFDDFQKWKEVKNGK